MNMQVLLMSGRDSVMKSVSYESVQDGIALNGIEFKSRLYRFKINKRDLEKIEHHTPDELLINFKSGEPEPKDKKPPAAGQILSENAMIHKFSSFAQSIAKVSISQVN
jgi:hypothetical protein